MTGDAIGMGGFVLGILGLVAISVPFLVVAIAFFAIPRWRARLISRGPLLVVTLAVLALPAAIFLVWMGPALVVGLVEQRVRNAQDHPVIDAPTVVAGISFPARSVLAYERNSDGTRRLVGVRPPQPVSAGGLELSEVRLSELDRREIFLRLAHDQRVEEWPCSGSELVRFYSIDPDQELSPANWTFLSCRLVWDFKFGAVPVAGLTVDKLLDGSGWRLINAKLNGDHLDGVEYSGFTLKDYFSISLDPDREPTVWTSVLARSTRVGDIQYSGSVHVSWYSSGRYVFEVDDRAASLDVRSGKGVDGCVLHDASGKVLGTFESCTEAQAIARGEAALPASR
jgi:hypothetical protein